MRVAGLNESGARITRNRASKRVSFIGVDPHRSIHVEGVSAGAEPERNARVIASAYGPLFGIKDPGSELTLMKTGRNAVGGLMVRLQQVYQGVPVIGGELIVNMDNAAKLIAMNGEAAAVPRGLSTEAQVSAADARSSALAAIAKWYKTGTGALRAAAPTLAIYDPRLISPDMVYAAMPSRTRKSCWLMQVCLFLFRWIRIIRLMTAWVSSSGAGIVITRNNAKLRGLSL